jgi:hypothetical protein
MRTGRCSRPNLDVLNSTYDVSETVNRIGLDATERTAFRLFTEIIIMNNNRVSICLTRSLGEDSSPIPVDWPLS